MKTIREPQNARLDFRVKQDQKALIERAANVEGRTVTDFAVAALIKAAHETIERSALTTLSMQDAETFLGVLDSDSAPNAALKAAAQRYTTRRG